MKKAIKLIIIIALFLIFIFGVLTVLFFKTDLLKSDKELFYYYAIQVQLNEFSDFDQYNNIANKKEEKSYKDSGKVSIDLVDKEDEEILYEFKKDISSNDYSGTIAFNQSGENKINVNIIKNNDLIGEKTFLDQYLVLKNGSIEDLINNFSVLIQPSEEIEDIIKLNSINNINIDTEKANDIIISYLKLFLSDIPEKKYSTLKNQEILLDGNTILADAHKFEITIDELREKLIECMYLIREDQDVFDLIKEFSVLKNMTFSEYQDKVNDLIRKINYLKDDSTITVIIYSKDNKPVNIYLKYNFIRDNSESIIEIFSDNSKKIEINNKYKTTSLGLFSNGVDRETNIVINKMSDSLPAYNAIITSKKGNKENFKIEMESVQTIINPDEYKTNSTFKIKLKEDEVKINFENTTSFDNNISIDKLEESEYELLNELPLERYVEIIYSTFEELQKRIEIDKSILKYFINPLGSLGELNTILKNYY